MMNNAADEASRLASQATGTRTDPDPSGTQPNKPLPRTFRLDPSAMEGSAILSGSPETVTMRSGYVVLAPGTSVGTHTTGNNEEALVVLGGTGEMRLAGGSPLRLSPWSVLYCPPSTQHDVINTGADPLRYVWLVAKAL